MRVIQWCQDRLLLDAIRVRRRLHAVISISKSLTRLVAKCHVVRTGSPDLIPPLRKGHSQLVQATGLTHAGSSSLWDAW